MYSTAWGNLPKARRVVNLNSEFEVFFAHWGFAWFVAVQTILQYANGHLWLQRLAGTNASITISNIILRKSPKIGKFSDVRQDTVSVFRDSHRPSSVVVCHTDFQKSRTAVSLGSRVQGPQQRYVGNGSFSTHKISKLSGFFDYSIHYSKPFTDLKKCWVASRAVIENGMDWNAITATVTSWRFWIMMMLP